jgi:caffeoyl-CoA O-methyltransferase
MTSRTENMSDELHAYLVAHGSTPDPLVDELLAETRTNWPDLVDMSIAPEQARFFTLFTRLLGARHVVEVGTFTGLSSISFARGLAEGGRLVCCDVSVEFTAVAQKYWARAGVADRVELRLGPAADTLRAMPAEPHVDLCFIDADKDAYRTYWSELVLRMRPGGVLFVDNVLRHGHVIDPDPDAATVSMREFNDFVLADDRVESVMLPIGDGLTMARVKP